ncbi:hypothetical protein KA047_01645 [Candidatus Saccharibacteria bacterium]|jgi:hypothetical protein|nr:hypothetical protein [Candidatus Saccharibacteria bacterium]
MPVRDLEIPTDLSAFFEDPFYLPTYDDVVERFNDHDGMWGYLGAQMGAQGMFFCEYYTREYIEGLAEHLMQRADANQETIVLEVGAGAGRLSRFLGGAITHPNVTIIPTDLSDGRMYPGVEAIDYKQALQKYEPSVVLSAWMPFQSDWTAVFRQTPSVMEYVLIGEAGPGSASGTDATWDSIMLAADGFTMNQLSSLARYQLSLMTSFESGEALCHSTTVSFLRNTD